MVCAAANATHALACAASPAASNGDDVGDRLERQGSVFPEEEPPLGKLIGTTGDVGIGGGCTVKTTDTVRGVAICFENGVTRSSNPITADVAERRGVATL